MNFLGLNSAARRKRFVGPIWRRPIQITYTKVCYLCITRVALAIFLGFFLIAFIVFFHAVHARAPSLPRDLSQKNNQFQHLSVSTAIQTRKFLRGTYFNAIPCIYVYMAVAQDLWGVPLAQVV